MNKRNQLLSDLHNLELDRQAIQMMHDDISSLSDDIKTLSDDINSDIQTDRPGAALDSLLQEKQSLFSRMLVTVNHVSRLERLLQQLSPDERLVIDRMLVHPDRNAVLGLMESLHCEKTCVYSLRAQAIQKLLRLRWGASAEE